MKIVSLFILVALHLTALTPAVLGQPINFNWSTHAWPSGSHSQTYFNVGGGNNLAFNVTGNVAQLNNYAGNLTPVTTSGTFGGSASSITVLALAMDQPNTTNSVLTKVNFSNPNGVRNVSFSIFDIDQGSYQDQITVTFLRSGVPILASNVTVTHVNAQTSVTTPTTTTTVVRGINGSVNDTGANSGLGNALFQVAALTVIDEIDIQYGNGPTANNNPGQQWIFISDISFTAIPEPSTLFLLIGTPALMGSAWYFRNRKKLEKKAAELAAVGNTAEAGEQEESAVVAGGV